MKFNIRQDEMLPLLDTVHGCVDKGHGIPILRNLLMVVEKGRLSLAGTDNEVEIVVSSEHISKSKEDGKITASARKLLDICKSLQRESDIEFSLDKDRLLIRADRSRFGLTSLPADEFPKTDIGKDGIEIVISCKDLRCFLEDTMFSMASDDVRYALRGILLELGNGRLRGVATDGHRLALKDFTIGTLANIKQEIIIPRKGVMELRRLLDDSDDDVKIKVSQNHIQVTRGDVQLTSKLIDAKYPDYRSVVPDSGKYTVKTDREILKQCLRRASVLSDGIYRGVSISIKENLLKASASNPEQEQAEEEIDIEYKGVNMEIGFNVAYLLDALSAIKTDNVLLNFTDSNSSCLLLPECKGEPDCKYVIMPMKI